MKKFLTLILALALAFGLTVPALAFTSDDSADDSIPYELSIYLVEYDDNDLFGIIALPESDRGYAKNEIVAAVVELVVPDGENPDDDDYSALVFGGVNVDLNVADNDIVGGAATLTSSEGDVVFLYDDDDDRLIGSADLEGDETYKWLFFAKVEDDDAMLVAKLVDGTSGQELDDDTAAITITLDGVDYDIARLASSYTITVDDVDSDYNGAVITIDIDDDNVSEGMSISFDGDDYPLGVNTSGELGLVDGAVILTSGDEYDNIMDVYEDVVVDAFGMDYFLIGNYVRDSFFNNLSSPDTLVAMVNIEPWTAYVTVPDNIVVDPPKTGDAASIMGFVMVALSGAGVVALRKRG
ncbi:MAG: hypothetical protein AAGU77_00010 [Bacillota bacterium]